MKAEWEIPKYHFDGFFKLSCIFNDGCPIQDLIQSLHILGIHHIPNPYLDLMSITNGAKLFYDTEYGQSGLYLYDLNDIIKCNMNWQKSYLNKDLVDKASVGWVLAPTTSIHFHLVNGGCKHPPYACYAYCLPNGCLFE